MRSPLLLALVLACDMPPLPESSEPGTTAADSTLGHSSTGEPISGSATGEPVDATSSTGEPSPGACYAEPCVYVGGLGTCGPGLICLPHPTSGQHMCVAECGPLGSCYPLDDVACDQGPPPQAGCRGVGVILGCFPFLCTVPEDCTAPSLGCKNGICY